jgi:hypothetical protein
MCRDRFGDVKWLRKWASRSEEVDWAQSVRR